MVKIKKDAVPHGLIQTTGSKGSLIEFIFIQEVAWDNLCVMASFNHRIYFVFLGPSSPIDDLDIPFPCSSRFVFSCFDEGGVKGISPFRHRRKAIYILCVPRSVIADRRF